jgi:hypothetical protein
MDIYGSGPSHTTEAVSNEINITDLNDQIKMKGHIEHHSLLNEMLNYKGLLLPSAKETFGMSYIEALATGNTMMYYRDTGIDGFFESPALGVAVSDQSVSSIAVGILKLENDYEMFFSNICEAQEQGVLKAFTAGFIGKHYNEVITNV